MQFQLKPPDLNTWREGNTGVEGVWQFSGSAPGPNVLITALIHGNELCGAWALINLLNSEIRPVKGKLTLIFCNLDAFDAFGAENYDAARFVEEDMNRIWSPDKLSRLTSKERRRAVQIEPFIDQADWLLDLHSMHEPALPLLLTGLLTRNIELAFKLGAPANIVVDAGHQDGARMRDYGKFSVPGPIGACALLIECGFHGDPASVDVAMDMIARFLSLSGLLGADQIPAHWRKTHPSMQIAVKVTHAIVALTKSLTFSQNWQGLQCVAQGGTELARDGDMVFKTPYDNCTLIMPSLRQLQVGVTVMRLAQKL